MLERLEQSLAEYLKERPSMEAHGRQPLMASIGLVKEAIECLEAEQFGMREAIASEAADVMMWLLVLSSNYGFDIIQATLEKIEQNNLRFPAEFFLDEEIPFEQIYLRIKRLNGERK